MSGAGPVRVQTVPGRWPGVRVLELAGMGPAPFCAMMLADVGATACASSVSGPRLHGMRPGPASARTRLRPGDIHRLPVPAGWAIVIPPEAWAAGLAAHRKQLTFDYLDTETEEVKRGQIAPADRAHLRRVRIFPLGAARRATPKPPRAWRVVPRLAGPAELGFWTVHGYPASIGGQVQTSESSFALTIVGLFIAGPWLTTAAARVMARWTSRLGTLIAARRLADTPGPPSGPSAAWCSPCSSPPWRWWRSAHRTPRT